MSKKTKHNNIPPLRFVGFSEEWQEKKLGEVGSWDKGQPLGKGDLNEKSGTPCIHYGELFVYNSIIEKVKSKTELPKVVTSSGNDILFPDSDVTPDGLSRCSALEQRNIILGAGINILRLHQSHKAPFCSYSIIKNKKQIISRVTGTTVRHIHPRELSEVIISLPSLAEQEQIGEFFRALDELIGAKEEELEKLRQMKAALLEAMFPNDEKKINVNGCGGYKYIDLKHLAEGFYFIEGSADTPRLRFRGFTEPWQRKKLGEVAEYNSTGVRICDVSDDGQYELYDASGVIGKVKSVAYDQPYISIIKDGSGVGRVRKLPALTNCLGTMGCIVPRIGNNIDYIYSHLETKDFSPHIISGAIPHLYFRDYSEDSLHLPSLEEQERIGEFFRSQDEGIAAAGEQIERLKAMKQACLERMFA